MAGRGVRNTLIKPARFARYALYGRALPISKRMFVMQFIKNHDKSKSR